MSPGFNANVSPPVRCVGIIPGPLFDPLQTLWPQPILSRAPDERKERSGINWLAAVGIAFRAKNSDTKRGRSATQLSAFGKKWFGRFGPYVSLFKWDGDQNVFFFSNSFLALWWQANTHQLCEDHNWHLTTLTMTKQHLFDPTLVSSFAMSSHYPLLWLWRSQFGQPRTATHAMEGEENWGRGFVLPEQRISLLRTVAVDGSG